MAKPTKCTHPMDRYPRADGKGWHCRACNRIRRGYTGERNGPWEAVRDFVAEWGIVTHRDVAKLLGVSLRQAKARCVRWSAPVFQGRRLRRVGRGVYARATVVEAEAAE